MILKAAPLSGETNSYSLHELFLDQAKEIYDAEAVFPECLNILFCHCNSEGIRKFLEQEKAICSANLERLKEVFRIFAQLPQRRRSHVLYGLARECRELAETDGEKSEGDLSSISVISRISHFKAAMYENLLLLSRILGLVYVGEMLKKSLGEEKMASIRLAGLAEACVISATKH